MTTFTLIGLRKILFNRIEDHTFSHLVREMVRCIFSLANKHVCMPIQMFTQPIKIITDSCRIITFRNHDFVGKPGACNNRLHVNKIFKCDDSRLRVAFSNFTQPSNSFNFGYLAVSCRSILFQDGIRKSILTIKIIKRSNTYTKTLLGKFSCENTNYSSGATLR